MSGDFNSGSGNSPWIGSESRRVVCPTCSHIVVMDSGTSGGVMCSRCLGMVPANAAEAPPLAPTAIPEAAAAVPPPVVSSTTTPLKSASTPVSHVAEANQVSGKVAGKGWIILVIALGLGACCLPCGGVAIIAAVLMSNPEPSIESQYTSPQPAEIFTDQESVEDAESLRKMRDDSMRKVEIPSMPDPPTTPTEATGDSAVANRTYAAWQQMRAIDGSNDSPGTVFWGVVVTRYPEIDLEGVDPEFVALVQGWQKHALEVQKTVDNCATEIQAMTNDDGTSLTREEAMEMADDYLSLKRQGLSEEFENRYLELFRALDEQRTSYYELEVDTAANLTSRYGLNFE